MPSNIPCTALIFSEEERSCYEQHPSLFRFFPYVYCIEFYSKYCGRLFFQIKKALNPNKTVSFKKRNMLSTMQNTIYLIGMPGVGKTTFGNKLAAEIGWDFVDIDTEIEANESAKIADIFAKKGEEYFRAIEHKFLQQQFEKTIVATGGGTPCYFDNINWMKKNGMVIWLNRSAESIAATIEIAHRPLLNTTEGNTILKQLEELLAKRLSFYFQADIFFNNEIKDAHELAALLMD